MQGACTDLPHQRDHASRPRILIAFKWSGSPFIGCLVLVCYLCGWKGPTALWCCRLWKTNWLWMRSLISRGCILPMGFCASCPFNYLYCSLSIQSSAHRSQQTYLTTALPPKCNYRWKHFTYILYTQKLNSWKQLGVFSRQPVIIYQIELKIYVVYICKKSVYVASHCYSGC